MIAALISLRWSHNIGSQSAINNSSLPPVGSQFEDKEERKARLGERESLHSTAAAVSPAAQLMITLKSVLAAAAETGLVVLHSVFLCLTDLHFTTELNTQPAGWQPTLSYLPQPYSFGFTFVDNYPSRHYTVLELFNINILHRQWSERWKLSLPLSWLMTMAIDLNITCFILSSIKAIYLTLVTVLVC